MRRKQGRTNNGDVTFVPTSAAAEAKQHVHAVGNGLIIVCMPADRWDCSCFALDPSDGVLSLDEAG